MDLLLAASAVFLVLYVVDRLLVVPSWMRALTAIIGTALALGLLGRRDDTMARNVVETLAAGAFALILSDLVAILQAATDALRVRVISAATRRGGRVPPI